MRSLGSNFDFPPVDSNGLPFPDDLKVAKGENQRREIVTELPWRQVAGVKGPTSDGRVRDILLTDETGEFAVAGTQNKVGKLAYLHAASDPEKPGVSVTAAVVRPAFLNRVKAFFGGEVQAYTSFEVSLPVIKNDVKLSLN